LESDDENEDVEDSNRLN